MKKRDLEKLLQNSLPKQPPDLWDKIEQSYFIEGELPPVKKRVPWFRYAAAAACVGLTVLIGAQMLPRLGVRASAGPSDVSESDDGSEISESGSEISRTDMVRVIMNGADDIWKEKYPDITITNEYKDSQTVALFGSLKSDSRQGVVQVVYTSGGGNVQSEKRFLSKEKHGALYVYTCTKNLSMSVIDEDGLEWNFDAMNGFSSTYQNSSPLIINDIDSKWKEKYPDITITNEWLSLPYGGSTVALFGSLKSDPRQGVAEVVALDSNGNILHADRFLSPEKHGAVTVCSAPGSEEDNMHVYDEDGLWWSFDTHSGFDQPAQATMPQIVNNPSNFGKKDTQPQVIDINNTWKNKYSDIYVINGWLSAQLENSRILVLCGSLKSDPRQGVAQVVIMNKDGSVTEKRFLSPGKNGALTAADVGTDCETGGYDRGSKDWKLNVYNGFESN